MMPHGANSAANPPNGSSMTITPSHVPIQINELNGSIRSALLRVGETNILLNCGDPTPTTSSPITSFTALGIAPGTIISAILITDWCISSCGMLMSFLSAYHNHHNRKGKEKLKTSTISPPRVLLTHTTLGLIPQILKECKGKDVNIQYMNDPAMATVTALTFSQPHVQSIGTNSKVTFTAYRAGHVVGGCLYSIELDGTLITFVEGFSLSGSRILRPAEFPLRNPHVAILNSAYIVEVSETRTVMEREFCKEIRDTIINNGKVIIPVFGAGCFFHDMLALLQDYWTRMRFNVPIFVTSDSLLTRSPLLADSYLQSFLDRTSTILPSKLPDMKLLLESNRPMVIFTAGASISSGDTAQVLQTCGVQPDNLLVLSEFRTKDTVNYSYMKNIPCSELTKSFLNSFECRLHEFPCGEEVDGRDVLELARQCHPSEALILRGSDANDPFLHQGISFFQPFQLTGLNEDDVWSSMIPRDLTVRLRSNLAFQGGAIPLLILAESRKILSINSESSGIRRLKKKKHLISFQQRWKYLKGLNGSNKPKLNKKKKSTGFQLSMILSNEPNENDENEIKITEIQPNIPMILDSIHDSFHQWLGLETSTTSISIQRHLEWLRIGSVDITISTDWSITMNWSYEDEKLASRILGIAQQVIEMEYFDAHGQFSQ